MDRAIKSIKHANKTSAASLRASQQPPEVEGDEEHGVSDALTAEELMALVKVDPDKYGDGVPIVGSQRLPHNMAEVLNFLAQHKLKTSGEYDGTVNDLVDESILRMRVEGLSVEAVSRRLGLTPEKVAERLTAIFARQQSFMTNSEYRQLQINRIEAIINMLWGYVELGDPEQTKNLMVAIERLNRMFELESEKSTIEVNIVTDAQSRLIIAAVLRVLEKVMEIPEIAELKLEQRVIDGVTFEALEEAEKAVQEAASSPLVIDKKELKE